ncbi:UNVERIFIED_CONTAM: hypothetical protein FKN15_041306 [Acipenser sinensis]
MYEVRRKKLFDRPGLEFESAVPGESMYEVRRKKLFDRPGLEFESAVPGESMYEVRRKKLFDRPGLEFESAVPGESMYEVRRKKLFDRPGLEFESAVPGESMYEVRRKKLFDRPGLEFESAVPGESMYEVRRKKLFDRPGLEFESAVPGESMYEVRRKKLFDRPGLEFVVLFPIRWTKTAGSASDRFQDSSVFNETLRISNIQRHQGGRYYCKAENGLGSPAIKSIRVDVYWTAHFPACTPLVLRTDYVPGQEDEHAEKDGAQPVETGAAVALSAEGRERVRLHDAESSVSIACSPGAGGSAVLQGSN